MEKLKKALIKFSNINPTLFPDNNNNDDSRRLIQQQFSQFFNVSNNFHTPPNHPPYAAMIHKAIWELNQKGGSNEESISKYIKREYVDLPWAHSTLLKHHLEKLCDREEISLTLKQRYCLAGGESVAISEPESDNHLKRKRNSESGKKPKSRPDSKSGKESSRHRKKKKKSLLDIHETNKKKIMIFQEQDQDVEPLNKVADEHENITDNGMHEPQYVGIEYPSLERPSDKELTGICGNNKGEIKRRKKRKLRYTSIKNSKHRQKQKEAKANLKQHNEVTDNESHEQNQIIEVNTYDIQFQEENEVGSSVTKVYKNDNSGRRVWTRSQLTEMSKKDAISSSKLAAIPNHTPNGKLDIVEYLSEEKQQSMNRQRSKLRSSQNNTNAKDPTATTALELTVSQDYTNMPTDKVDVGEYLSEEKEPSCEIIEVKETEHTPSQASSQVNKQRAKLRSDSQQYQQPEDSEAPPAENKPNYKGCGSSPKLKDPETNEVSPKTRSAANLMKTNLSAKMGKFEGKRPTTNLFEDEVLDRAESTNKKSQLKHKLTRSGKMRDSSC